MAEKTITEPYYKSCRELDICNELIEKYFNTRQYKKCFEGHLALAEQGYPLGYLERYKYTVICTSYQGKWILSRHKKRNTWET